MKKIKNIICIALLGLFVSSCEEVIELDLKTAPPRLVVNASLVWQKGTDGKKQTINLTETTAYYSDTFPRASNAIVWVKAISTNQIFTFPEGNPGVYECQNFVPIIGESYLLHIEYKGDIYEGKESLYLTPAIERMEQIDDGGIMKDRKEVLAYFQDDATSENYYYVSWKHDNYKSSKSTTSDEFFNGNEVKISYTVYDDDDELKTGSKVTLELSTVSKQAYNYLSKIFDSSNSGNPFSSPIGVIRGNMINITNPNKYPLGYFNILDQDKRNYTVQ